MKVIICVILQLVAALAVCSAISVPTEKVDPCATVLCAPNTKCVLKNVQCFTLPCDPIPSCEPIEESYPTCATVDCQPGYTCRMNQVQCIRAPCPPIPECIKA